MRNITLDPSILKSVYFTLLFSLVATVSSAQQLPQFTQFAYNTMSVNPAYAGSRETLNVTALHRDQWRFIESNPTTSTLSVHTPIKYSRFGVGLTYINDHLGGENYNYIYGNVSYTVPLAQNINLALGLNGGTTNYSLRNPDVNDPFFNDGFTKWNPNFGAGIYLSSNKWYFGMSTPRLLNTDLNKGESAAIERNSYYTIGGYVFDLGDTTKFRTTVLAKVTNGAPATYDLTGSLFFFNKLWVGAGYRFNDADGFSVMSDIQISKSFRVGAAFDFSTSNLNPYKGGTPEIILIYELPIKVSGALKSPRFF